MIMHLGRQRSKFIMLKRNNLSSRRGFTTFREKEWRKINISLED